MANDTVKIVVLSDGTWQTAGGVKVWTITQTAYDLLCRGDYTPDDLIGTSKVSEIKNVDT